MKIAIISDIHDNLANLEKCLFWCEKKNVEKVICCGDVADIATIDFLHGYFRGEIFLVKGNMELYREEDLEKYARIKYLGRTGWENFGGKVVGICHEPIWVDQILADQECDIIFYGHTHKPWTEKRGNTQVINPGTLGGVFQKATFAFWDTSEIEPDLVILEMIKD